MSDDPEVVRIYGCRWAWCRLNFVDNDALGTHVVFEHIRRAIPVLRKEIPMLRRAEEGLGDSLKISDIMRDPSSSLSQESSKALASSRQELPPSSSLPSPPTSSPAQDSIPEDIEQQANFTGVHPTFASFSSPAGSLASLNIPTSPTFSTLVHRTNKRKEASEPQQERLPKRSKQHFGSQESASSASMGSDRSVEEHLTQTSGRGGDGDGGGDDSGRENEPEPDAQSDGNVGDSEADRSVEDVMIPPTSGTPSSSPSQILESSQDAFNGELNWDGHVTSPQSPIYPSLSSSQGRNANPFFESMSQPPSQLQLSSPLYHIHRTPSSQLHTTKTDTNSSVLSLPLNPVAISPAGFIASTPQRQTWYQPSLRRRVSGRSPSGEATPKPTSRKLEPTGTFPTVDEEQSQSQSASKVQDQVPSTPQSVRESPLAKKLVFRSGTLRVTPSHPSTSPLHSQSQSRGQSMASHTNADEDIPSVPVVVRDVFTIPEEKFDSCDTQSQFDQQLPLFEDMSMTLSPYPPLQSQAPYQSQSFSQLD